MRILLLTTLLFTAVFPSFAHAAKEMTVQEQYERGIKYMNRGYYVKALEDFNRIRNYHRDDPYAVKSELAIADLYFKKSEWDQARLAYEDFLRLHPRHEDVDYVVYRLGLTSWKKAARIAARDQSWTRQAVNTWTGFDTRYPESEYVDDVLENLQSARERLARKEVVIGAFYFKREAWPAVIGRMEGALRTYPQSEQAPRALALLAYAYLQEGEADDARQAADRLVADHPDDRYVRWLRRKAPELFE